MNSTAAYIIIGISALFIIGIKLLSSPKTARLGNLVAAAGMLIALLTLHKPTGEYVWSQGWSFNYTLIAVGIVIGLIIGAAGAYSVKMTSMPQMVALFNGVGGGAAALVASLEFTRPDQAASTFLTISMLFATLIGTNDRLRLIIRTRVYLQNVFHLRHILCRRFSYAVTLCLPGLDLVFFSIDHRRSCP